MLNVCEEIHFKSNPQQFQKTVEGLACKLATGSKYRGPKFYLLSRKSVCFHTVTRMAPVHIFFSVMLYSFLMFTESAFLNFQICHSLKIAEWRDGYFSKMKQHINKTRNCYEVIVRNKKTQNLYLFNITYDFLYQCWIDFLEKKKLTALQLLLSQKEKKKNKDSNFQGV